MGYACPVCGDPQADAGHLANHLAITAIARGGEHEAWLDDHVSDWSERDDDGLATAVSEQASEADYPQVFEDTTGGKGPDHDHDHSEHGHPDPGDGGEALPGDLPVDVADTGRATDRTDGELDAATREAILRAREMTAQATADEDAEDEDVRAAADENAEDEDAQATADDSETE